MLSLFDFESLYIEQTLIQEESDKTFKYIKSGFIHIPLSEARKLNLNAGDTALFT
jgi:pyrrolidone-carboxylate peptidase